jgi:hypothetical protein
MWCWPMNNEDSVRYEPKKTTFLYARLAVCIPLIYFFLATNQMAAQSPVDAVTYYSTLAIISGIYLAIFNVGISLVSQKSWIELSRDVITLPRLFGSELRRIRWEDIIRITRTINFGYLIVTDEGEHKINASFLKDIRGFESNLKKFVLPHTDLPDNLHP